MPNWCLTDYVIEGPKNDLEIINKAICDCIDGKLPVAEKSSQEWQGNVLQALRIPVLQMKGRLCGSMRGFFYEKPHWEDDYLTFSCEEAWARTNFAEALQIRFKDISVYWYAEVTGCELYSTNDDLGKHFPERFAVEVCINDNCENEYFCEKEELFKWLREYWKLDISSDEDIEKWNEENEDCENYIYVHEIDIDYDVYSFGDDIELLPEPCNNLF